MDRRDKPRLRYESLTQASARTGLSIQDLRRFIANGRLSPYRCGARIIRVDPREVDSLGSNERAERFGGAVLHSDGRGPVAEVG